MTFDTSDVWSTYIRDVIKGGLRLLYDIHINKQGFVFDLELFQS